MLLRKIVAKQKAERLSDYKFTEKLGIDRSTWTHTRLGHQPIGYTVLCAILRTYPELEPDVFDFMRDGGKE